MVVALGPGKFYGSSLPRPRFYSDVKLSPERIDPPPPVMEPFLEWAREAHWSMGGLSSQRHRLQGRIEGSIKKLKAQAEYKSLIPKHKMKTTIIPDPDPIESDSSEDGSASPLIRERKRARRLWAEFEQAAEDEGIASRTRSRVPTPRPSEKKTKKETKETVNSEPRRTSPRKKN
ncbi:uncharacterized protein LOC120272460 [Dioscorea cayenensis subsp. rotundata]|uniref:Uncharacterized protein LOC120272460 n=1 Tax=Dioscorea cayennensis subsp. rotundata TaxID=55577 RepID=A0AB40C619_DIOCR|nr:uncharacterized protein LOC120272460 [Dioscorea cayenensis subsp. rotundata]